MWFQFQMNLCIRLENMSQLGKKLQVVLGPTPDQLVSAKHPYRRMLELVPFGDLCDPLAKQHSGLGRDGYGVERLVKCLLLQWMEDLSDRELERYLDENIAAKLFCGFELTEDTPVYSTFSLVRKRLGTEGIGDLYKSVNQSLKSAGLVREVFTFVDATQLISKISLWEERDKAITQG